MTRCLVIGHPVAHSLSPAIHRAAYAELGVDWTYAAVDVEPGAVEDFVCDLSADVRGLSVTAPHKDDLVALGAADEVVRLSGAANTWVRHDPADPTSGPLVRNTDVPGYGVAFAAHGLRDLGSAIIVGNGATARSALIGLSRVGVGEVTVLARRPERAAVLVALGEQVGARVRVEALSSAGPGAAAHEVDIVVSTVPAASLATVADALADRASIVFDSVYDPWPTALAEAATRRGRMVLNGLDLLAGQAVEQIRWHTGGAVAFELLRSAAQDGIVARQQS